MSKEQQEAILKQLGPKPSRAKPVPKPAAKVTSAPSVKPKPKTKPRSGPSAEEKRQKAEELRKKKELEEKEAREAKEQSNAELMTKVEEILQNKISEMKGIYEQQISSLEKRVEELTKQTGKTPIKIWSNLQAVKDWICKDLTIEENGKEIQLNSLSLNKFRPAENRPRDASEKGVVLEKIIETYPDQEKRWRWLGKVSKQGGSTMIDELLNMISEEFS